MAEQIFFESGKITVTSARAIFDEHTFALAGITSVRGVKVRTVLARFAYLLAVIFLVTMFAKGGIAYLYMPPLIVGLVYLAETFFSKYVILFSSASGEAKAYANRSKQIITDIVKAINDAIVHRG